MVTVAPGTTAPDGSVTVPLMDPELDCAWTVQNIAENTNTNSKRENAARRRAHKKPPEIHCFLRQNCLSVSSSCRRRPGEERKYKKDCVRIGCRAVDTLATTRTVRGRDWGTAG